MSKITFNIDASKYFSMDADKLAEVKGTKDYVIVNIDMKKQTAEYCWIPQQPYGDNPGNYNFESDSFEGVLELLQEKYKEWRKASEEMLEDGFADCGEQAVREDFSNYAGLEQTISFEDMLQLEK